jgi:hypothetical protein
MAFSNGLLETSMLRMCRPTNSEPSGEPILLRQNDRQLAELEVEWSELGAIRQFDFRCTFPNFDRRKTFSDNAQSAGFQVRHIIEHYGSRCHSSICPLVENSLYHNHCFDRHSICGG